MLITVETAQKLGKKLFNVANDTNLSDDDSCEQAETLIKEGADVNYINNGSSSLSFAANKQKKKLVELLLKNNAKTYLQDVTSHCAYPSYLTLKSSSSNFDNLSLNIEIQFLISKKALEQIENHTNLNFEQKSHLLSLYKEKFFGQIKRYLLSYANNNLRDLGECFSGGNTQERYNDYNDLNEIKQYCSDDITEEIKQHNSALNKAKQFVELKEETDKQIASLEQKINLLNTDIQYKLKKKTTTEKTKTSPDNPNSEQNSFFKQHATKVGLISTVLSTLPIAGMIAVNTVSSVDNITKLAVTSAAIVITFILTALSIFSFHNRLRNTTTVDNITELDSSKLASSK